MADLTLFSVDSGEAFDPKAWINRAC